MTAPAPTSTPCRLLLISGSLRAPSTHGAVLKTAQALSPSGTTAILYAGLGELPHFNPDVEANALPASAAHLRAQLALADGVLFCTPEYAGTLPGTFKNLLDWTVGEGLYGKPVAFINPAPPGRAQGAYATLRTVLGYVSADLVEAACRDIPVPREAVTPSGIIEDAAVKTGIAEVLSALTRHIANRPPAERG